MCLVFFILLTCNTVSTDIFHISFERSGGFAGMTSKVEVDSKDLSENEKKEVLTMIEKSGFFAFQPDSTSRSIPDQFQYTITIEQGGQKRTLELGESSVPDSLRPLIDYLSRKARGG